MDQLRQLVPARRCCSVGLELTGLLRVAKRPNLRGKSEEQ